MSEIKNWVVFGRQVAISRKRYTTFI